MVRSEPTDALRRTGLSRVLALALALVGCSTLLGLEDGKTQGACSADRECAPDHACLLGACRSGCSSDDECGEASRCLKAIGSSACIPVAEGCGDACPEG